PRYPGWQRAAYALQWLSRSGALQFLAHYTLLPQSLLIRCYWLFNKLFSQFLLVGEIQPQGSHRNVALFHSPPVSSFFGCLKGYNGVPIVFPSARIGTRDDFAVVL